MTKEIVRSFEELKGRIINKIEKVSSYTNGVEFQFDLAAGLDYVDEIRFTLDDGETYVMKHYQDCCEDVYVEDINGDPSDIVGSPVLFAEESSSNKNPEDTAPGFANAEDSFTWTFYRLGTINGTVVIRWYGESNGYYSESVSWAHVQETK